MRLVLRPSIALRRPKLSEPLARAQQSVFFGEVKRSRVTVDDGAPVFDHPLRSLNVTAKSQR